MVSLARRYFFQLFLASDGSPRLRLNSLGGARTSPGSGSHVNSPRAVRTGRHRPRSSSPCPPPRGTREPRTPSPEAGGAERGGSEPRGRAGRAVPAPLGPAAPCGSSSVNQPDFTPARPVLPVLYPRRLLVSLLRCEPGARPPLPLRLRLGECAGGGARGSAERRGEERRGTASRPPAPAAGSPGAAPRLGPGAPRWSLPRGSPASCSAARSACPPLPRGVPGTEVGARRVPRPFAASGLLASPCLRRRVPGSPPVSSHGCEPRGLLLLPNFFCGRFCRVSSCERRARTGTGIGMEMRTGTRSVAGGTAPCPPCRPCPTCTGQGSVLEFPVRDETHGSSSTCSSSRRLGRRRRPEVPGRPLAPLPVAARGVPVPSRPIPAAPRGFRATRSLTGLQSARRVLPLTLRALPKRLRAL